LCAAARQHSGEDIILVAQILSAITSALLALVSWQHLAIPNMSILNACNHGLAAIAGVFEHHQTSFHFDDASIPLIPTSKARSGESAARFSMIAEITEASSSIICSRDL